MPKKRYQPEEIAGKLRQVDVHQSQGISVADAISQIGVSDVTYYRWCLRCVRTRGMRCPCCRYRVSIGWQN